MISRVKSAILGARRRLGPARELYVRVGWVLAAIVCVHIRARICVRYESICAWAGAEG